MAVSNRPYESIDILCQEQLNFVRNGLQLTYQEIDKKILEDICDNLFAATKQQGEDFSSYFYRMLKYEEAYELVELRQLDYTSTFLVKTDSKWDADEQKLITTNYLHLKRPPTTCRHYHDCKAYVFGPDLHLETVADIRFGAEIKLELEWSKSFCNRLKGNLATLKISPRNPLLMNGLRAIAVIESIKKARAENGAGGEDGDEGEDSGDAEGQDSDEASKYGNYGMVSEMFKTYEATKLEAYRHGNYEVVFEMFKTYEDFTPVVSPKQDLHKSFKGDSFRKEGIKGAIASKVGLASVRPYLMCTSAWSDETDWLECLVQNINHLSIKEIGILCPDSKTVDQIKGRPNHHLLSVRVNTLDEWPTSQFDYLIMYKAHSIGPAEAIRALLTVKQDGCVVLAGDPKMPNLRARGPQIRSTCGSILQWFYNKSRYPEYFREESVCMTQSPVCFGYAQGIFSVFNEMCYDGSLVNMAIGTGGDSKEDTMLFYPAEGVARISGCSPYNLSEAGICLELVKGLIVNGLSGHRIGVLTTYCAQKKKIANLIRGESQCSNVAVGILEDFENRTCDCLIISTVETSKRACVGKRYPFDDLLYDKSCFNMALTRAKKKIILIGDKDVLGRIDHWAKLIDLCKTVNDTDQVASERGQISGKISTNLVIDRLT